MQIFRLMIIVLIAVSGCGYHNHPHREDHHPEHHGGYRHDASMHSFHNTERYAAMFESEERIQWQKPDMVVEKTGVGKGDRIADIGAGTGYFTRRFAAAVGPEGAATGLDIEPGMVEYMKRDAKRLNLKNYRARLIDPSKPNLSDNSYDLIFLCNTYHHIGNRIDYFHSLKKALKKNGKLVIVDFKKINSPVGPPLAMKIDKEDIKKELRQAGYRLEKEDDFLPHQYFLMFR